VRIPAHGAEDARPSQLWRYIDFSRDDVEVQVREPLGLGEQRHVCLGAAGDLPQRSSDQRGLRQSATRHRG
jgi:hypothetical protein